MPVDFLLVDGYFFEKGDFVFMNGEVRNADDPDGLPRRKRTDIRGVLFDSLTPDEAFERAVSLLTDGTGGASSLYTPNSEITESAAEDPSLRRILNAGDLVVADGAGVIKASVILGTPLPGKVAGVELGERLLAYCAKNAIPVFFLGGRADVAEKAADNMSQKYAGLRVTGCHDGYFDKTSEENEGVIGDINDSGARLLFVCFGAPAQEKWIDENAKRLRSVRLCVGLGGSLDIYAGTAKRAPKVFISTGTEWLYRLARQPSRIGRMAKLPKFIIGAKRDRRKSDKAKEQETGKNSSKS